MEDEGEKVLYIQDGVSLKSSSGYFSNFIGSVGSLSIVEYPGYKISIEWKPCDFFMFESVHEQEWTVVKAVSEKSDSDYPNPRILQLPLEEIDKIINKSKIIHFVSKNDKNSVKFYFPHGNSDTFSRNINLHCETKAISKDSIKIIKPNVNQMTSNSLSEIDMFEDVESYAWNAVSGIVRNLKDKPVETVWVAGSKVLDIVFGTSGINSEDESITNNDINKKSTDEYEVINKQPSLPTRHNISRGIPLNDSSWQIFRDVSGRIQCVDEVKDTIFRGGINPTTRCEVWKYLLNYYPWDMTDEERKKLCKEKEQEYFKMKQQWKTISPVQENRFIDFHEHKTLIEKDANRTDRSLPFYAGDNNPNIATLYDILMTYAMYNFDLGYVQGMSDLLSPILFLMKNEVEAFWCFAGFMEKVHNNFEIDQAGMKHQLQQLFELLSFVNPDLTKYLSQNDSANMYFCFRWLLVLFKREFEPSDIMKLWEVLWTGKPCENFHLFICIAILDTEKSVIIEREYEFCKILKHINDLSMKLKLESILIKAEAIYYQLLEAPSLPNNIRLILGMEPIESSPDQISFDGSFQDKNSEIHGNGEEVCVNGDNSIKENNVKRQPDTEEVSFQRSLEMHYL